MISLRTRSTEQEAMDDLDCHGEVLDQTLRELEVINRLLGGDQVTINGIGRLIKGVEPSQTSLSDSMQAKYGGARRIVIGDYGCGGGDLAMKIVKWGRKQKLDIKVEGIDANPHIVEFARKNCSRFKEISFEARDVFSNELRSKKYDITTATLFLHHFTDDQLVTLLRSMLDQSRLGVVINDIHRHTLSYRSIKWLTALFSKSSMIKSDAPLSVRRAFKRQELINILDKASIRNYSLTWKWAFRWQLIIKS
jgi:2-polyprenyl-3-methyl-5-hydroxy-6-metoxy-1,4-benzoquinol methylase